MSIRRFFPFASNSSVKTGKGTMRSRRPPTYTSYAPTYQSHATASANEENSCAEWDIASSPTSDAGSDHTERLPTMGGGSGPSTSGPRYSELKKFLHLSGFTELSQSTTASIPNTAQFQPPILCTPMIPL
jgi:hypothetical protein